MALQKDIVSHEGFTTNYHKIEEINLHDNILNIVVNSYVSREYREFERPADQQSFNFEITLEEEEAMGIRKLAYTKIKELPDWKDAEDC